MNNFLFPNETLNQRGNNQRGNNQRENNLQGNKSNTDDIIVCKFPKKKVIYLDNNSTTCMSNNTIKEQIEWINKGNPSSDYYSADECKKKILQFKKNISNLCKFNLDDSENNSGDQNIDNLYKIFITSGASESNSTVIRSVTESYAFYTKEKPHVITSTIEHKSLLDCVKHLHEFGFIELTLINPNQIGLINPSDVQRAIRPNTALISIIYANNETGAINDIKSIGEIAHTTLKLGSGEQDPDDPIIYKSIPFHTDAVQMFGKYPPNLNQMNIDFMTISFHKLYGPPGIGAIIINSEVFNGYQLCPCISGSQQNGFRGGTENISLISAANSAMVENFTDRNLKNNKLKQLKTLLIKSISDVLPTRTYYEYLQNPNRSIFEIIIISSNEDIYLPNTILLSVVKKSKNGKSVCNSEIKKELFKNNIIVSIGSACNTNSPKASHVLYAMNIDQYIRKGILRISLGDHNTPEDIQKFISSFYKIVCSYKP